MIRFSKFIAEGADATLADKAKKSGFSLGILKQVYKRGMAAWKVGHKPGTTPQQWGMARVNSFITGGRTRVKGDPDLWAKQKGKIKKPKKEDVNEGAADQKHNIARDALQMMASKHEREHEKSDHLGHDDALKAIDHAGSKLNKHGADHPEFKSAMNKAKDASKKAMKMNNESVAEEAEKHVYRFATKTKQGNIHHPSKDDDGAKKALKSGKSLLAAGIKKVSGNFNKGDHIKVLDKKNNECARGLASFTSGEVIKIMGRHSKEIEKLLGYVAKSEVIHKDDMVEM